MTFHQLKTFNCSQFVEDKPYPELCSTWKITQTQSPVCRAFGSILDFFFFQNTSESGNCWPPVYVKLFSRDGRSNKEQHTFSVKRGEKNVIFFLCKRKAALWKTSYPCLYPFVVPPEKTTFFLISDANYFYFWLHQLPVFTQEIIFLSRT